MTQTLERPTLKPAPARLSWHDRLLLTCEVCTATACAVLIRLPGGSKTTWMPLSHAQEVHPDRRIPDGCRMWSLPKWLFERVRIELEPQQ